MPKTELDIQTLFLVRLINEAQVFLVLANSERGALFRIDIEIGLKPGTLTEADAEIHNLDNMRENMQTEAQPILKVAEL